MSRIHLFTSLTAGLLGACLSMACLAGGAPEPVQPGDMLGSTGNVGNSLIDIDPTTGAGSLRGSLGSFGPVTELRFRADGVLFATTGSGQSNLITVDPNTAQETLVGEHDFGSVNGLAFIGNTLYGAFFEPDQQPESNPEGIGDFSIYLVTIDLSDASLTKIGQIEGYERVRGLAWDENTGTLYGVGSQSRLMPQGLIAGDVLFTIDPGTAATTVVGSTGFELGAITFGPDGTLYGGTTGGLVIASTESERGSGSASLVTIDPDTGESTIVGGIGVEAISGLDFVPTGVEPGPTPLAVPFLSFWTLLLLALALLAIAGWSFRPRGNVG